MGEREREMRNGVRGVLPPGLPGARPALGPRVWQPAHPAGGSEGP